MRQGKLIVFYGINNVGKSTQARLLTARLNAAGIQTQQVKYAMYDLEPSGSLINDYLRHGNPNKLSPREFQIIQVLNRYQNEPRIWDLVRENISVVAEDYTGTGIAWGAVSGVDKRFLMYMNSKLYKEDLAFLLLGDRHSNSIEQQHVHESNEVLTMKAEEMHDQLADELDWVKINGINTVQQISDEIFELAKLLYAKKPLNFYFATSVMGERTSYEESKEIVNILGSYGSVLSEHVIRQDVLTFEAENVAKGVNIYERDMQWVEESDYVVVQGSGRSFGVGREVERATILNIPTLFLYKGTLEGKISRMATHDRKLTIQEYFTKEQLPRIIGQFIDVNKCWID